MQKCTMPDVAIYVCLAIPQQRQRQHRTSRTGRPTTCHRCSSPDACHHNQHLHQIDLYQFVVQVGKNRQYASTTSWQIMPYGWRCRPHAAMPRCRRFTKKIKRCTNCTHHVRHAMYRGKNEKSTKYVQKYWNNHQPTKRLKIYSTDKMQFSKKAKRTKYRQDTTYSTWLYTGNCTTLYHHSVWQHWLDHLYKNQQNVHQRVRLRYFSYDDSCTARCKNRLHSTKR